MGRPEKPVDPDAGPVQRLAWQLRQAQEAEDAADAWATEGHLFTMDDGRPIDPSYVTRVFQKLRKGAGDELPPLSSTA